MSLSSLLALRRLLAKGWSPREISKEKLQTWALMTQQPSSKIFWALDFVIPALPSFQSKHFWESDEPVSRILRQGAEAKVEEDWSGNRAPHSDSDPLGISSAVWLFNHWMIRLVTLASSINLLVTFLKSNLFLKSTYKLYQRKPWLCGLTRS